MSQAATVKGEGPVPKQFKYDPKSANYLQVDTLVWNRTTRTIKAYEVKRGHGEHDAGKKRSIRRDLACIESHLIDYAKQRGFKAKEGKRPARPTLRDQALYAQGRSCSICFWG